MKTKIETRELFKWVTDKTTNGLDDKQLDWLMDELKNTCPDGIELVSDADTRTEPALPIQNVSRWAYLYDNAKPLMIGFIASMLLSTTYKLIETIIIKIALIVNG